MFIANAQLICDWQWLFILSSWNVWVRQRACHWNGRKWTKTGHPSQDSWKKWRKKTLGEKPIGSVSCGQKNANWHKIAIYPFFLLSTSMFWGREDRLSRCEDILKALSCSSRASAAVAPGRTDRRRRTNRSNVEGSNSLWQSVLRAKLRGGERWIATNEAKVDPSRLDFLA